MINGPAFSYSHSSGKSWGNLDNLTSPWGFYLDGGRETRAGRTIIHELLVAGNVQETVAMPCSMAEHAAQQEERDYVHTDSVPLFQHVDHKHAYS